MDKLFVLVVSLWGNNGTDWIYIGNQYVLNEPMPIDRCVEMANLDNWSWWETNEYYTVQLSCEEAK